MISDAIIGVVLGILTWLISLFPNSALDLNPLESFINAGAGINYFIDVPALISVLGIIVSFELFMMTIRGIIFLWKLVKP